VTRNWTSVPGGRRSERALANTFRNLAKAHAKSSREYRDRLETYRELAGLGEHPEMIAARLNVCLRTVERYKAQTR
jgi:hypothetical protein